MMISKEEIEWAQLDWYYRYYTHRAADEKIGPFLTIASRNALNRGIDRSFPRTLRSQ